MWLDAAGIDGGGRDANIATCLTSLLLIGPVDYGIPLVRDLFISFSRLQLKGGVFISVVLRFVLHVVFTL